MKGKKNFSSDTVNSWEEQHHETKNMILDAAAKLFDQQGYHKTTMREVADAVDLTIGTLYHYIKNKEDVLFEICDRLTDEIEINSEINLREMKSPEKRIREIISSLLKFIVSHDHALSVFLKEHKNLSSAKFEIIRSKRKKYEAIVKNIIKEGIKNGDFSNADPKITATGLFGMCNWAAYWLKADGRLSIDEIIDIFSEMVLNGILIREKPNK